MNRILGVDPGCSGGLVILLGGKPIEWMRMPTMKVGKTSVVNVPQVVREMLGSSGIKHAYIEQVHSMTKQGVTSTATFMRSVGAIEGAVQALGIPMTHVTPQTWKKRAGLIGKDKDAARSRAIQLWPEWGALGKKGEGQALADAALIALHGQGK